MKNPKFYAAKASIDSIYPGMTIGVGTGSTVDELIPQLPSDCRYVASSIRTGQSLNAHNLTVLEFNEVDKIDVYIDGADAIYPSFVLLKGGGGAMTREKILATFADKFIVIADGTKWGQDFKNIACPVEVIDFTRSHVARQIRAMGAHCEYRSGFKTDQGHVILDVYGFDLGQPNQLELSIKKIPGVIDSGLFALRRPECILIADNDQVKKIDKDSDH
tara:strand:+ start:3861 stop:4514 length:654 start_codon:yes stop_codon:yes gene_type:complete